MSGGAQTLEQARLAMSNAGNYTGSSAPIEIARPEKEDKLGNLQKNMKVVLKKRKVKTKKSESSKKKDKDASASSALLGLGSYGSDSDTD